ncbi:DNA methylase [Candidatus Magnetomorum sp. HK-1]|nr:DNA methylase [Candidatus Magnetomorum sp. HK-1]
MNDKVFIEEQFPVSKVSKESYKERKAGASQTLTGLGKWWGRKPLILIRASIIGMLMPVSDNPKKDREIFLKILTMDNDGLWLRRTKSIPAKIIQDNDKGWRADAYLYCVEAKCPATGLMLPLAPSWVISEKYNVCAVLKRNDLIKGYDIDIITGANKDTMAKAKLGTVRNNRMICPETGEEFSISGIRGDRVVNGKTIYGLRLWEKDDFVPRPDDVFQERLYCVRWVETYVEKNKQGKVVEKKLHHISSVTETDQKREKQVLKLLNERFKEWQTKGFIPSRKIEHGYNTDQPIRERGWTHWHHLFNHRQLLINGQLFSYLSEMSNNSETLISGLLHIGLCADWNSKLLRWVSHIRKTGMGGVNQSFYNQALNTLYNYTARNLMSLYSYNIKLSNLNITNYTCRIDVKDARKNNSTMDLWITDPPYADAINYHELTDFFLSWYEKQIQIVFPEWYTDTKRALAIKGSGNDFKQSMVDIYSKLTKKMPQEGIQMVMFTHQNSSVWADLAMILWAAGLKVTAAWTISTETAVGIKKGNYVQGTVLLILRKRLSDETTFLDEIYPEIEDEVRNQLDHMMELDDTDDPNFGDTDYQLAAYAAALRVLTQYSDIEGHDIRHELFRQRESGEKSAFETVIDRAVEIASDHLVPAGFHKQYWKNLTAPERLYLKGIELEKHMEARSGAYQELAKGFGVRDYKFMYAKTKANAVRFKTGLEFKRLHLGGTDFSGSLIRNTLFAIHETIRAEDAREGLKWFHTEIDHYWNQRKLIIEILNFLSTTNHIPHMPHWKKDADAAKRLAGAVENDHGGRL